MSYHKHQFNDTLEERLMRKTVKKDNGCWEWTGTKIPQGYGYCRWKGDKNRVHRWSFMAYKGEIPKGMHVLHTCDNPSCLNPDHLFIGTNHDNIKDKMEKGRMPIKENKPNAKLNMKKVEEIRLLAKSEKLTHQKISDYIGVSRSLVTMVINNKRWT